MTLWEKRLAATPAEAMMSFTASFAFDRRLAPYDVEASLAHVRALDAAGLLEPGEADVLAAALSQAGRELATGGFEAREGDEDVHTAIERRVTEIAGPAGARLHTGRSRNDQVATALRLYARDSLAEVARLVLHLQEALLARAEESGQAYMPGYTHLQRAQPVLLAHHLLAHGWALARDADRLFSTLERLASSPLGAGALGGSSLPLLPDEAARLLGLPRRFENSLDAVSDRDFVVEALFDLAMIGVHLSRIGEEVVIFSTEEFGFLALDDAWATGSSMLPQKKNPDVAELARAKAGRLLGNLTGLIATLKGLPLSYNRDLQEDKEPLFDSVDQVVLALVAMEGLVSSLVFNTERMEQAADSPYLVAVDLADWLVARGRPFREAHGVVALAVRESLERGATLAEVIGAHPAFGREALSLLEPGSSLERRRTPGGAGREAVAVQLERFRERLQEDAGRLAAWRRPTAP